MEIPSIDWARVKKRVADSNSSDAPFYLADVALHEVFSRGLTVESVPLCIMAVNSFWNARVEMEPSALKNLCEQTVTNLSEIKEQFKGVQSMPLPADSSELSAIIEYARNLLVRFLKAPLAKRMNYVFASKFLHCCCPSSLPIVDSLSVKTINHFSGRPKIWVPNANSKTTVDRCLKSYEDVIHFYNSALEQLDDAERNSLIEHDFKTQPHGFRKQNTTVRILDKWLWMEQKRVES